MLVIRPARQTDLSDILVLAQQAGIGITTLPADTETLTHKIAMSIQSFANTSLPETTGFYLFVSEDIETKHVVGTAAIDAKAGGVFPFYSYKCSQFIHISHLLQKQCVQQVLYLVNDYQHQTELCTLYLLPAYRKNGNGVLLSRSRFLFMAQFPHLFPATVFAEMRGFADSQGNSPFWDSLGRHFFNMSFQEADRLTATTDKQFIVDLMPHYPIYVSLLSEAAQRVIGQPHPETQPALKLLEREGFRCKGYIDIFDGGPTIEASLKSIKTARGSMLLSVAKIQDKLAVSSNASRCLLANTSVDFRACRSVCDYSNDEVILSQAIADALTVNIGDTIRVVAM